MPSLPARRPLLAALSLVALAGCAEEPPPPPVAPAPPPPPPADTAAPAAPAGPPVAPVRPVTDTYFGVQVVDPYRWMEDMTSPEFQAWMKAQADYTHGVLAALPGRDALAARIKELDHAGDRVGALQRWGDHYFYLKREQGHDLPKYCVRDGLGGAERVLIDPEPMGAGGKHVSIDWTAPSLDGKLLAYGLSTSGSEDSVLHVLDVATGKALPDVIDRAQFGGVSWLDDTHFFYTRLQKLAPGAPQTEKYKRAAAYEHELGRDPDKDPAVFGAGVVDAIPVKDTEIGIVGVPYRSKWVLAIPGDGVRNEFSMYAAPVRALAGAKTPWKKVIDVADDATAFDVRGDDIYFLTHHGASRFQIIKTSLVKPDVAHATVVMPESAVVLRGFGVSKDGLYATALDAGIARLRRVGFGKGAKVEDVPLPFEGAIDDAFQRPDLDGIMFTLTGWTVSPRVYAWDAKAKGFVDTKLAPPSPVDFSSVTSEEVRVKSADGTMVPMSIVHAKAFAKDGSHPTWLDGYGGYGISLDPSFSAVRLAWIEKNGLFATCHARGGGELGEEWHKDGMLLNKHHTIEDMIACAQWLVDNRYTTVGRLAGEGTSNGGITIGGAVTQRPDLFAAALIRVGVSNPLRFEETQNVLNVPEFGTVKTEEGFKGLFAMDAYMHVKDGTKYPAILLTTGATDPRVSPWQVTKMAARLQAATASGKPVLLRVDYDAGHGMGSTAAQRDEELADEEAFLLSQFEK
jgi:prolyl oligopeptidase